MIWDMGVMFAAVVAAIAAIISSFIAMRSDKSVKVLENSFQRIAESNTFREKQLSALYFPMHIHLNATRALFKRFGEKTTKDTEKINIEHQWRYHNNKIFEMLIENSVYLDMDAPKEITGELLVHFTQWEIVYKLKYVYKEYNGPVFSGISKFGFRGFPKGKGVYFNKETGSDGIDGYFSDKTESLRKGLYDRLSQNNKEQKTNSIE